MIQTLHDNEFLIFFVKSKSLYGKFASFLVGGPYHHVIVAWYSKELKEYMAVQISLFGGIRIQSLALVLKKYEDKYDCIKCASNLKYPINTMKETIGFKYDILLLVVNFWRLIANKLFNIVPKKTKVKKTKYICSEWTTELLQKTIDSEKVKELTPYLTSPEHLRQAIMQDK